MDILCLVEVPVTRERSYQPITTYATSLPTTATISLRRLSWFTHIVYAGVLFSLPYFRHHGVLGKNDALWLLRSVLIERDHLAMNSPALDCPGRHRASQLQPSGQRFPVSPEQESESPDLRGRR